MAGPAGPRGNNYQRGSSDAFTAADLDEWGYPGWGIGIADTPTAGQEQIILDYCERGPAGEPQVVYVDQEDDYASLPSHATSRRSSVVSSYREKPG